MAENSEADDLDGLQYANSTADGLPARLVGDWSKEKHHYLERFINIFETGMHKQWKSRTYIDLFAGPGVCMFKKSRELTNGSPLLALKTAHPFTQYFFSDLDPTATAALRKRCAPFKDKAEINIFEKDCNAVAADIAAKIDPKSLCLAFLDPTGLHVKFSTIETLTKGKQVDLIIHFSHGESIKRNIAGPSVIFKSQMDEFFGGDEWRAIYERGRGNPVNLTNDLLVLYQTKLAKIGYKMEPADAVLVKNTKNVPMYCLIFASKHSRGMNFWKKAKQIESKGQRGLPFDLE